MGTHSFCCCANCRGTKLDNNRNFSWTNCNGRLSSFTHSALGSTYHYAFDCHCSRLNCNLYLWRKRHWKTTDSESGYFEFAIGFCDYSADSFCERQIENEWFSYFKNHSGCFLDYCLHHCFFKCQIGL
ncbi:hypothetical protein D3C86_1685400 [compost metagenome]